MDSQEIEKPTTTIIVDKDMIDTIIIAMEDLKAGCENRIKYANNKLRVEVTPETIENLKALKALSEFSISQIPKILSEIKEVYPELEEREEATEQSKIITIEKPSWSK